MNEQALTNVPRPNAGLKMIAGLFLLTFGVLLAANNLNLVDADRYLDFWPVFVIGAGAVKALEPGQGIGGLIIMSIGAALLASTLDLVRFNMFDLWPLLLVGAGLLLLARGAGLISDSPGTQNVVIFTSPEVQETSSDYRGSRISAVMSGYKLDLTGAQIAQSPAVLNVFAMWSGVEVIVPEGWEVVTEVTPFMAGVDVKTSRAVMERKGRLVIRGFVMWASVEVRSGTRRTV
ncbi:MAG TPA: DUF5668 domain-containing protein [Thermoanaerobaculia bacterium]|nr:DUF5668 domain-containing protein [Thermoanaerobaculia bacterium]